MPESVLVSITIEEDAHGYWRAFVRAPGLERHAVTASWKSREQAFMELVERLSTPPSRSFVDARSKP